MHFLNKMDIKGMTMVLYGSAQSFCFHNIS